MESNLIIVEMIVGIRTGGHQVEEESSVVVDVSNHLLVLYCRAELVQRLAALLAGGSQAVKAADLGLLRSGQRLQTQDQDRPERALQEFVLILLGLTAFAGFGA